MCVQISKIKLGYWGMRHGDLQLFRIYVFTKWYIGDGVHLSAGVPRMLPSAKIVVPHKGFCPYFETRYMIYIYIYIYLGSIPAFSITAMFYVVSRYVVLRVSQVPDQTFAKHALTAHPRERICRKHKEW